MIHDNLTHIRQVSMTLSIIDSISDYKNRDRNIHIEVAAPVLFSIYYLRSAFIYVICELYVT